MTNTILLGKPNTGNPYVRFSEGEVASAKSRRGSLLYKLIFCIIVGVLTSKTYATTFYVKPSGNDSNNGLSSANAKATIRAAVQAVDHGGVVRVSAGTYHENISINKQISLIADEPFTVVLDGKLAGRCIDIQEGADGTLIEGLILTHGVPTNGGNTYGGGINCCAGAIIRNCIFKSNGSGSQYFGGGLEISQVVRKATARVYNCLFVGNVVRCSGGGVLCEGYAEFDHCTVCGNICSRWNQIGGLAVASGGVATLKNCIIWGNASANLGSFSGGDSGSYNISYSCIEGGYPGAGNIASNPRFSDTEQYFVLGNDSPCIDAGNPNERDPDASRADMGFSMVAATSEGAGVRERRAQPLQRRSGNVVNSSEVLERNKFQDL